MDSLPLAPPGKPYSYIIETNIFSAFIRDSVVLPLWLTCKESACNTGDLGLIPGLERSSGEGKGYPLQYSGQENSMDTPWVAKKFSRQEYWNGLPCPPPGDLPNPGMEPRCPALQADSFPSEPPGKPMGSQKSRI